MSRLGGIARSATALPGLFAVAAVSAVVARFLRGLRGDVFSDDAYYYIVAARNFVESGRFTFDGTAPTNGFHPLLFWLEVPLVALVGPEAAPLTLYRSLLVAGAVLLLALVAGVTLSVHRALRGEDADQELALILLGSLSIFLFANQIRQLTLGMESTVAIPLAVGALLLAHRERYAAAGFVGALTVAARLDALPYFVVPLAAVHALAANRRQVSAVIRVVAALTLPAILFVALYGAHNLYQFGHWLPIHGALKSSVPQIHFQWDQLLGHSTSWRRTLAHPPLLALVLALAGGLLLALRGTGSRRTRVTGAACVAITLAHIASFTLFQKWSKPVPPWYVGLPLLAGLAATTAGLLHVFSRKWVRPGLLLVLVYLAAANVVQLGRESVALARSPAFSPGPRWLADAIEFIRSRPEDALWANTDCGRVSFWSGRRFVNLDGLMNDYRFQERLRRGELGRYLDEREVRFLLSAVWDRPEAFREPMYEWRIAPDVFSGDYEVFRFYVYSHLYGTHSDAVVLPREAEIWRSREHNDGGVRARRVAFDLRQAFGSPLVAE